ncbi:MAG: transcriptional regulator, LysR family [Thermoleophilia bacterium]|nr:transcriptional regulator, LysR family [Thermoleophilia bacterium]MCZ4496800.1 transcriptional regulator, LysR family [Thermoleophilia bacterium]
MGDVDRLRAFLAIHRTGSVTEAARRLHMSQPAVSQQLQALEAVAGRRLFRRLPRGVEPTPAGLELAEQVGSHLDAVEEAWGQWLGRNAGESGNIASMRGATVFLGGPSEFLTGRVLPALAPLLVAGVRLRVQIGTDDVVTRAIEARELDLAILTHDLERRGITVEPLVQEEFVLVAAPDVAVELGRVRSGTRGARQLEKVPMLAVAEELPLIRSYWQEVFGAEPDTIADVVADSLPALAALAERGLGMTVLPRHVCEDQLADGRLVQLIRPRVAPTAQLYLAWGSGSRRTPAVIAAYQRIHGLLGHG